MPDCELIRAGFPAQPVAAYTAIGFVLVGIWTMWRHRSVGPFVFGVTLIGIGVTSFQLHGWAGTQTGALESVAVIASVSWLALWVATHPDRRTVWIWLSAMAAASLVIGIAPVARHALTAAAIIALGVAMARSPLHRDRRMHAAIVIFLGALVVYVLSRTGGPWCDPASPIQGHGLWHLMAALALGLAGETVGATERGTPPCP